MSPASFLWLGRRLSIAIQELTEPRAIDLLDRLAPKAALGDARDMQNSRRNQEESPRGDACAPSNDVAPSSSIMFYIWDSYRSNKGAPSPYDDAPAAREEPIADAEIDLYLAETRLLELMPIEICANAYPEIRTKRVELNKKTKTASTAVSPKLLTASDRARFERDLRDYAHARLQGYDDVLPAIGDLNRPNRRISRKQGYPIDVAFGLRFIELVWNREQQGKGFRSGAVIASDAIGIEDAASCLSRDRRSLASKSAARIAGASVATWFGLRSAHASLARRASTVGAIAIGGGIAGGAVLASFSDCLPPRSEVHSAIVEAPNEPDDAYREPLRLPPRPEPRKKEPTVIYTLDRVPTRAVESPLPRGGARLFEHYEKRGDALLPGTFRDTIVRLDEEGTPRLDPVLAGSSGQLECEQLFDKSHIMLFCKPIHLPELVARVYVGVVADACGFLRGNSWTQAGSESPKPNAAWTLAGSDCFTSGRDIGPEEHEARWYDLDVAAIVRELCKPHPNAPACRNHWRFPEREHVAFASINRALVD